MAEVGRKPKRRWPARLGIEEDGDELLAESSAGFSQASRRKDGEQEILNGYTFVRHEGRQQPSCNTGTWNSCTVTASGSVLSPLVGPLCHQAGGDIRVAAQQLEGGNLNFLPDHSRTFQDVHGNNFITTESRQADSSQAILLPENDNTESRFGCWDNFAQPPADWDGSQGGTFTAPQLECTNAENHWGSESAFLETPLALDQWLQPDDDSMWFANAVQGGCMRHEPSGSPASESVLQQANGLAGAIVTDNPPNVPLAANSMAVPVGSAGSEKIRLLQTDIPGVDRNHQQLADQQPDSVQNERPEQPVASHSRYQGSLLAASGGTHALGQQWHEPSCLFEQHTATDGRIRVGAVEDISKPESMPASPVQPEADGAAGVGKLPGCGTSSTEHLMRIEADRDAAAGAGVGGKATDAAVGEGGTGEVAAAASGAAGAAGEVAARGGMSVAEPRTASALRGTSDLCDALKLILSNHRAQAPSSAGVIAGAAAAAASDTSWQEQQQQQQQQEQEQQQQEQHKQHQQHQQQQQISTCQPAGILEGAHGTEGASRQSLTARLADVIKSLTGGRAPSRERETNSGSFVEDGGNRVSSTTSSREGGTKQGSSSSSSRHGDSSGVSMDGRCQAKQDRVSIPSPSVRGDIDASPSRSSLEASMTRMCTRPSASDCSLSTGSQQQQQPPPPPRPPLAHMNPPPPPPPPTDRTKQVPGLPTRSFIPASDCSLSSGSQQQQQQQAQVAGGRSCQGAAGAGGEHHEVTDSDTSERGCGWDGSPIADMPSVSGGAGIVGADLREALLPLGPSVGNPLGIVLQGSRSRRAELQELGSRPLMHTRAERREGESEGATGADRERVEEGEGRWEEGQPFDCTALVRDRALKLRVMESVRQGMQQLEGMRASRQPMGIASSTAIFPSMSPLDGTARKKARGGLSRLHTHMLHADSLKLGNTHAPFNVHMPADRTSAHVPRGVSGSSFVNAVTASSGAGERRAAMGHVSDSVEERMRARVMAMARAIDRGDTDRFYEVAKSAKVMAVRGGTASQRVMHYLLTAFLRRLNGTAYDHFVKPIRRTKKEIDEAHQWFSQNIPGTNLLVSSTVSTLFNALRGAPSVHVVIAGFVLNFILPALLRRLAAQPAGCRPRVRVTAVDASVFVCRGDKQMEGFQALLATGMQLRGLAKRLGVEFQFECVAVGKDGMGDLPKLSKEPGQARAVCALMEMQHYPDDDVNPDQGPRLQFLQWVWNLQPDVFHFGDADFDGNHASFLDRAWHGIPYFYSWCQSHDAAAAAANANTPTTSTTPLPPTTTAAAVGGLANAAATTAAAVTSSQPDNKRHYVVLEELLLERQVVNCLGCEGSQRVQRTERMATWAARLAGLGFRPLQLPHAVVAEVSEAIGGQLANGFSLLLVGDMGMRLMWGGSSSLFVSSWTCGQPGSGSVQSNQCSD